MTSKLSVIRPKYIEIIIKDLDGVDEKLIKWDLPIKYPESPWPKTSRTCFPWHLILWILKRDHHAHDASCLSS